MNDFIYVEQSPILQGELQLAGAKNSTLVIMASSILIEGTLKLFNVPNSQDVLVMIQILEELGAKIFFDNINNYLEIDTKNINNYKVNPDTMKKMRASVLIMGPLLTKFGRAEISAPGGCRLGQRPINYHISNFEKMNVKFEQNGNTLIAEVNNQLIAKKLVLEYPSVGATENLMMAATLTKGKTTIVNAALEPEVLDLIDLLQKMGADIKILTSSSIEINGVNSLSSTCHSIIYDRLEAGSLLLATAITKGTIYLPHAYASHLDVFLLKLEQMGHTIIVGENNKGVKLISTHSPRAVSFKTGQYPCFPTDLQAPMMVAQCIADGVSEIEETVYENRLLNHAIELQKMGAKIKVEGNKATINGVKELFGSNLIAHDIRASCALVLAGLVAKGQTIIDGVKHFKRGYDGLEKKLIQLGAKIYFDEYPLQFVKQKQLEIGVTN